MESHSTSSNHSLSRERDIRFYLSTANDKLHSASTSKIQHESLERSQVYGVTAAWRSTPQTPLVCGLRTSNVLPFSTPKRKPRLNASHLPPIESRFWQETPLVPSSFIPDAQLQLPNLSLSPNNVIAQNTQEVSSPLNPINFSNPDLERLFEELKERNSCVLELVSPSKKKAAPRDSQDTQRKPKLKPKPKAKNKTKNKQSHGIANPSSLQDIYSLATNSKYQSQDGKSLISPKKTKQSLGRDVSSESTNQKSNQMDKDKTYRVATVEPKMNSSKIFIANRPYSGPEGTTFSISKPHDSPKQSRASNFALKASKQPPAKSDFSTQPSQNDRIESSAAIFKVECLKCGYVHIDSCWNAQNIETETIVALKNETFPHYGLINCFKKCGIASLRSDVIEFIQIPVMFELEDFEKMLNRRVTRATRNLKKKRLNRIYLCRRRFLLRQACKIWKSKANELTAIETRAVLTIQKIFRGYLARVHFLLLLVQYRSAVCIQRFARGFLARRLVQNLRLQQFSTRIQKVWRGFLGRIHTKEIRLNFLRSLSAITIQCAWRCHQARKFVSNLRIELHNRSSAIQLQRIWRGYQARLLFSYMQQQRKNAACVLIQRVWRGCMDRQKVDKLKKERLLDRSARCVQVCWRKSRGISRSWRFGAMIKNAQVKRVQEKQLYYLHNWKRFTKIRVQVRKMKANALHLHFKLLFYSWLENVQVCYISIFNKLMDYIWLIYLFLLQ